MGLGPDGQLPCVYVHTVKGWRSRNPAGDLPIWRCQGKVFVGVGFQGCGNVVGGCEGHCVVGGCEGRSGVGD